MWAGCVFPLPLGQISKSMRGWWIHAVRETELYGRLQSSFSRVLKLYISTSTGTEAICSTSLWASLAGGILYDTQYNRDTSWESFGQHFTSSWWHGTCTLFLFWYNYVSVYCLFPLSFPFPQTFPSLGPSYAEEMLYHWATISTLFKVHSLSYVFFEMGTHVVPADPQITL